MDILKDDVIAILSEKIISKSERNGHYSKFKPGLDRQISMREYTRVQRKLLRYQFALVSLTKSGHIGKASTLEKVWSSKKQKSFLLEHLKRRFRGKSLQFMSVLLFPF